MTTINVNTIEPSGSTLTVGESGDTIIVPEVKVNTLKDAGGGEEIVTFTSTGSTTWTAPAGATSVEYLVVAGGGEGGWDAGGGGGAGGYRAGTLSVTPGASYTVTVGAGGTSTQSGSSKFGADGDDSVFSTITSTGGGGGASTSTDISGRTGGSGGGGGGYNASGGSGGAGNAGGFTPVEGYVGGAGASGATAAGGGGGGSSGAGAAGGSPTNAGGAGTSNSITGSAVTYAAGGTGNSDSSGSNTSGAANTGDGGNGGAATPQGGAGGSGIVVLKHSSAAPSTLFVSNGSGVLSSVNSGFGGALNLLSTQTETDIASISFTSGIDSTYKEYIFKFININPATNDSNFGFQVNASGESGYNETITSTTFRAYHREDDGGTPALAYNTGTDQAQGTALQPLSFGQSNAADANMSGELHLFNPGSTTYVKNFFGTTNNLQNADYTEEQFTAGYINVTAAITNVQFSMSSGNFDGTIKMYGIS